MATTDQPGIIKTKTNSLLRLSIFITAGFLILYSLLNLLGRFLEQFEGPLALAATGFDLVALLLAGLAIAFSKRKVIFSFCILVVGVLLNTYVAFAVIWIFIGNNSSAWYYLWDLTLPIVQVQTALQQISFLGLNSIPFGLLISTLVTAVVSTLTQIMVIFSTILVIYLASSKKLTQPESIQSTQVPIQAAPTNMSFQNPGFQQQIHSSNWVIAIPGYSQEPLNLIQLRQMATVGAINSSTPLKDAASGNIFTAKAVPGIFSRRDYVTALLLSIFLGGLGIDRFYLGHTGLGIAKLLTAGGCGVWSLIDLILIAMRKVNDYEGMPLG